MRNVKFSEENVTNFNDTIDNNTKSESGPEISRMGSVAAFDVRIFLG
jgi:hypothetical protein